MIRDDEDYLFEVLEQIKEETHENNIMLKQIIKVLRYWIQNANTENENDFGRNVLANIISNVFDISKMFKR